MRFKDPFQVKCSSCGAYAEYAPSELIALRAKCDACGKRLREIGEQMRVEIANWSTLFAMVEVALQLEERFSVEVTDDELEKIDPGIDFVDLLDEKLEQQVARNEINIAVQEAIRMSWNLYEGTPSLAKPLADFFTDHRYGET